MISRQLGAPRINIGAVTNGLIKQSLDAGTRPAKAATKSRRHSRSAEAAAEEAGSDASNAADRAAKDAADAADQAAKGA